MHLKRTLISAQRSAQGFAAQRRFGALTRDRRMTRVAAFSRALQAVEYLRHSVLISSTKLGTPVAAASPFTCGSHSADMYPL